MKKSFKGIVWIYIGCIQWFGEKTNVFKIVFSLAKHLADFCQLYHGRQNPYLPHWNVSGNDNVN